MSFQAKTTHELLDATLMIEYWIKKAGKAKSRKKLNKRLAKAKRLSTELADYFLDVQAEEDFSNARH